MAQQTRPHDAGIEGIREVPVIRLDPESRRLIRRTVAQAVAEAAYPLLVELLRRHAPEPVR